MTNGKASSLFIFSQPAQPSSLAVGGEYSRPAYLVRDIRIKALSVLLVTIIGRLVIARRANAVADQNLSVSIVPLLAARTCLMFL